MTTVLRHLKRTAAFVLMVLGAVYLVFLVVGNFVPRSDCRVSQMAMSYSPSGMLFARHVQARQCEGETDESRVLVGEDKKGVIGALVFAGPAEYLDRTSGRSRATELRLIWRGEDELEIDYPSEIVPRNPGSNYEHAGVKVRVISRGIR